METSSQHAVADRAGKETLDVLVVGTDDWAVAQAGRELEKAGARVHRCTDEAAPDFPCKALHPGRGCPLDTHGVEVVVAVRTHPRSGIAIGEMGAVCGLRGGLPLVTAGLHDAGGLGAWGTAVGGDDDLIATCRRALGAGGAQR